MIRRAALGVITPLAIGVAAGHTADGTYAALGALPAGFVSFRGVSRTRVNAVAAAALGMAISTFAGAATADSVPWLLVPEVMLWAYVVGPFAALGPTATVVALQWPVGLLIGSALPLGPGAASVRAGLVLAGGLWQGALVASTWALSRGSAERAAVADSYLALGRYAAGLAAGAQGPPPPVALPGTAVLRDPNPLLRTDARLHLLNLRAYSRPGSTVAGDLPTLQLAARRARSDAEASADRLADEPDRQPMTGGLARLLTSAVHRMAQAALTLDAAVAQQRRASQRQGAPASYVLAAERGSGQPAGQPQAALDRLAAALAESTGILAASLREMRPPGRLPPLRRLQAALIPGDDAAADALFAATDGLVDAVDTAADILRRHLDADPAGP